MIDTILPVFAEGFKDPSEKVQIADIGAFTAFFRSLPKKKWSQLHPLLPDILNILSQLQSQKKDDELTRAFESIIELAEMAPKMFKPVLPTILEFCVTIASDKDMENTARLSALELLSTLADEAPNMCKSEPTFAQKVVHLCIQLMTEVGEDDDDASEWNKEDDINQSEENDEVYSSSKHSLDRLALKLGGEAIIPVLSELMPQLISSGDWRYRHAALMALSNVAEGCADILVDQISMILDMILPLINDPHPRVQWATLNALGQMSTDFADKMQTEYADRVVPALVSKMTGDSVPRVQVHAAAAMVNFAENATKEILEPYLDGLLTNLLTLLNSPKRYVIEQVITTISIIADAAQNKFIKYYDTLMPMLFNFMRSETDKEFQSLKAKSIECSSLIILAVGKEKAQPQFQEIVSIFANIQQNITDDDDPCYSYLVQAWGRLCQVFEKDFVQCLGGVMPPLLKTAKTTADLQILEDEAEIEQYDLQEGWEVLPIQGKYIGLHTAALDEKAQAIDIIAIYAGVLGEDFFPYVQDIVSEIIIPGLHFFYNDGVRYSALQAVPSLITSAEKAVMKAMNVSADQAKRDPTVQNIWNPIFTKLIELLGLEPLLDVTVAAYSCVCQCIELMYSGVLSEKQLVELGSKINDTMTEYSERVVQRQEEDNQYTEDVDDDDSEDIDSELIVEVNKAIHEIFKSSKTQFLPIFEQRIVPLVQGFLGGNEEQRAWAITVINDLIEYIGPDSWAYKDLFINHYTPALQSESSQLRLAAAYGIGIAAQHGGENFAQMCCSNLESLFAMTNAPEARSEENIEATENSCASIAKILFKYGSQLGEGTLNNTLVEWIKTLPVYTDREAAPYAYMFLCDLMDQNHESVTQQLPKVLESIALALQHKSVQGKGLIRLVSSFKGFIAKIPEPQWLPIVQSFPPETQKALHDAFSS